jgi:transcriptional regulator with PAS, ATPase and Fis domain
MYKDKFKNITDKEIKKTLEESLNVTEAAKKLGVSRNSLYLVVKKRGYKITTTIKKI